ncbi:hypothetical protein BV25DRAFT_1543091 [Artomyces pyxidatus]|uniref:Uncharacterized protein n=1 Tax=Artomyces pyxidatus TaxID=48021 RepID=A0ACB8SLM4_9AGAM|nr:hypothetical protein BV25DRAFT_1543091 [Artomyces pyxidatus]
MIAVRRACALPVRCPGPADQGGGPLKHSASSPRPSGNLPRAPRRLALRQRTLSQKRRSVVSASACSVPSGSLRPLRLGLAAIFWPVRTWVLSLKPHAVASLSSIGRPGATCCSLVADTCRRRQVLLYKTSREDADPVQPCDDLHLGRCTRKPT